MLKMRNAAVCAVACSLVAAGPAAADHLDPVVSVRVEAAGQAEAPGSSYVAGADRIRTDRACGGSGRTVSLREPTALGVLSRAADTDRDLRPLGVSDEFDFGLLVCRLAGLSGSASGFWLYKVDHIAPEVGADQRVVENGEEVLFYFQDTTAGVNTGDELVLEAPKHVDPGQSLRIRVLAYDGTGKRAPAAGAQLEWDGAPVVTDAEGRATLETARRGRRTLRAVRGGDIASAPTVVCVGSERSCAAKTRRQITGTNGADVFRGTREDDTIDARAGNDRIDVRGGGRDVVDCGRGRDRVMADRRDRVARSCERVIRR